MLFAKNRLCDIRGGWKPVPACFALNYILSISVPLR